MLKVNIQREIKENFYKIASPSDVLTNITPNMIKKNGILCPNCLKTSVEHNEILFKCSSCHKEFTVIDWVGLFKYNDYDTNSINDIHKSATLIIKKMKLSKKLIESLSIDAHTALEINLLLRLYMGFSRKTYGDLNRIIDTIDKDTLRRCIAYNPFTYHGAKEVSLAKYLFTYYTINKYYQSFISKLKHMFSDENRNDLIDQLKDI